MSKQLWTRYLGSICAAAVTFLAPTAAAQAAGAPLPRDGGRSITRMRMGLG